MENKKVFVIAIFALLLALIAIAMTANPENLAIPTKRPSTPENGSFVLNLTDNSTEIYSNGVWHYSGNGTTKP